MSAYDRKIIVGKKYLNNKLDKVLKSDERKGNKSFYGKQNYLIVSKAKVLMNNKNYLTNHNTDDTEKVNISNKNRLLKRQNQYENKSKAKEPQTKRNVSKSQNIYDLLLNKKEDAKEYKQNFHRYSSLNIMSFNNKYKNKLLNNNAMNKSNNLLRKNIIIKSSRINDKNLIILTTKLNKFLDYKMNKVMQNKYKINNRYDKNINLNFRNLKHNFKDTLFNTGKLEEKENKRPFSTKQQINNSNKFDNIINDILELNLNEQIPNYSIGKTIGNGSYAIVKIVTDKETNIKYAMKIYKKSEIKDKVRKKCIENEIEILKKIKHKNIIKLKEVIDLKEYFLIVQEYFQGISLSQYYNKFWRSEDLTKEKEKIYKILLKQIFEAVDYLHKNYIAHLDLKLENILINKSLEIKIIDFGFGFLDPKKTLNKFFGGTPNYMSPEIVLKRPYISIYSDIWSLGVLVFKLFCNEYPFKGLTEKDLYNSIKKGRFRIKYYVNHDVKKIINSMLVLEPNRRASCANLLKNPWFNNNIK